MSFFLLLLILYILFHLLLAHDGTALFTSIDAHRGCGFTFRGDVEILGHNALYWLTKTLPWKGLFDEEATLKVFTVFSERYFFNFLFSGKE